LLRTCALPAERPLPVMVYSPPLRALEKNKIASYTFEQNRFLYLPASHQRLELNDLEAADVELHLFTPKAHLSAGQIPLYLLVHNVAQALCVVESRAAAFGSYGGCGRNRPPSAPPGARKRLTGRTTTRSLLFFFFQNLLSS
jgi:hypothetical protein